jgi:hypothetical protein
MASHNTTSDGQWSRPLAAASRPDWNVLKRR